MLLNSITDFQINVIPNAYFLSLPYLWEVSFLPLLCYNLS